MSRPTEMTRHALAMAAIELPKATWRELAAKSQVAFDLAKATVFNMEAAGDLVAVGEVKQEGSTRLMKLFAPTAKLLAEFDRRDEKELFERPSILRPSAALIALGKIILTWGPH